MLTKDVLIITDHNISITITSQKKEIKIADIHHLLRQVKNNQFMSIEDNIGQAVELFKQAAQDKRFTEQNIVIAKSMDASLSLEIINNDMLVVATITSAWGGNDFSTLELKSQLQAHGIIYGLLSDHFDKHIRFANFQEPGKEYTFDAASGISQHDGKDATFERLINTFEERQLIPQESSNGKVDMHNLGHIQTVPSGTPLVIKNPAIKGTEGMDVYGKKIPPNNGEDRPFTINMGTGISADDENLLISTFEGIPFLHDGTIGVNDVLTVDDVDINLGNIEFKGDVVVKGDIYEGMSVISHGNISVEGAVHTANLQADGDIIIKHGVQGKPKEEDGSLACYIEAGGSVSAQYIQYSHIYAGGNVNVETQLLHSQVNSGGSVIVENSSQNKGTIFGGKIIAKNIISTVELGGHAGSKTFLEINGKLTKYREKSKIYQEFIEKNMSVLKQLIAAHDKVSLLKSKQEKQLLLDKLKHNIDKKVANIVKAKKISSKLSAQIDNAYKGMSIMIKGDVYDGVHLVIDKYECKTLQRYKAIKIRLKNKEIVFSSLTKK